MSDLVETHVLDSKKFEGSAAVRAVDESAGTASRPAFAKERTRSRILFLANSGQFGGGNRALLTLATGLVARGFEANVICPASGPMQDRCAAFGITSKVLTYQQPSKSEPFASWKAYRTWRRVVRSSGADLIHANDFENARSICLATWRADVPLVCHVHFPPTRKYAEWAFQRLPAPDVFVFNSRATQSSIADILDRQCPRSEQIVIHNAVDIEDFSPRPPNSCDTLRVGIIANLLPVKGHYDFLRMASLLLELGVKARFAIIGEDIYSTGHRQKLEHESRSLGLDDRVDFLGHCPNVPELIHDLDVVVCASHEEPFGLCLIEGMACEKPIVATRVGGIPEVVEDGVTGLLVPPGSPGQLAQAVGTLLADPHLRNEMGRAGRDRVLRYFTPDCHVERMIQAYQR